MFNSQTPGDKKAPHSHLGELSVSTDQLTSEQIIALQAENAKLKRQLEQMTQALAESEAHRRSDAAFLEHNEFLQTVVDHIPVMLAVFDVNGQYQWVNQAWEQTLGWTIDEIQQCDLLTELYPDPVDRQRVIDSIAAAEARWGDFKTRTRDGKVIATTWANIRLSDGRTIGIGQDISERKAAEETLRQYERIVSATGDGIILVDRDYHYQLANQAYLERCNKQFDEIVGQPLSDIIGKAVFETTIKPRLDRCFAGEIVQFETLYPCPTQGIQFLNITYSPYIELDGTVSGAVASIRNLTELKRTEAALQDSETQLNDILNSVIAAICSFRVFPDASWSYNYWSAGSELIFGYKPSELVIDGNLWASCVLPEDAKFVFAPTTFEAFFAERPIVQEYRFQHKDGSLRWISSTLTSRYDEAANSCLVTAVNIDVTDRKQTEEALRIREQEFRALVENATDLITRVDRSFRFRYVNPQVEREIGIPVTEWIGKTETELGFPIEVVQPWHDVLQQVFETGQEHRYEPEFPSVDGMDYWSCRIIPEFDSEGRVESALVISRNITHLKQTELALHHQIEKERTLNRLTQTIRNSLDLKTVFATAVTEVAALLEVSQVGILQYLPERDVWIMVDECINNPELSPLQGLEVPDRNNFMAAHIKQLDVVRVTDTAQLDARDSINLELAQSYPGAWLIVPLHIGTRVVGALDLLQYQRPYIWQDAEVELVEAVADQIAIAIQQSELYQQVQALNTNLEQQVETRTAELQQALHREEILKDTTDAVRNSLDEAEILQTVVRELGKALGTICCATTLYDSKYQSDQTIATIRYDYTLSQLSAQGKTILIGDYAEEFQQLLQGHSLHFCLLPSVINPIYPDLTRCTMLVQPILNEQEVLGELWLFQTDNQIFSEPDRRLVEQIANQCAIALRQSRLYQAIQSHAEELESLNKLKDEFLSTVSHELRSPMANIKMATQMLAIVLNSQNILDPRTTRYFDILKEECERETNLINDLLDLSRLESGLIELTLTPLNLESWIPRLAEPFEERARNQQQQLIYRFASNVPPLVTDAFYLQRILTELLHNACKYTPAHEQIIVDVTVENVMVEASAQNVASEGILGNLLKISVTNTGVSINDSERDRVFDKFYRITNHDPWKHGGTGLGLALVKKMVEGLGATIELESSINQTTFTLTYRL